jgi:hypothetical protein
VWKLGAPEGVEAPTHDVELAVHRLRVISDEEAIDVWIA